MDKRLFVERTKTPCCGKIYCKQCITDALLDDGLQCPGCGTDGVPIDDLTLDSATVEKVETYRREKQSAAKAETDGQAAEAPSGTAVADKASSKAGICKEQSNSRTASPIGDQASSKKRKADADAGERKTKSPDLGARQPQPSGGNGGKDKNVPKSQKLPDELAFMNQSLFTPGSMPPVGNFMMPDAMGAVNMGMWNPGMMSYGPAAGNQWNNMVGTMPDGPSMPNGNLQMHNHNNARNRGQAGDRRNYQPRGAGAHRGGRQNMPRAPAAP